MKRISVFAIALTFAATMVLAGVVFIDIPASGSAVRVSDGGKVAWIDGVSTNSAWTPAVSVVRESWRNVEDIETSVRTNVTYSVVWTNSVGTAFTNILDSALENPDSTVTDYWTNTVVVTTSTTSTVYRLVAAETNSVTAGTSYAAPGDYLMLSTNADDTARTTIAIEK
jgi:hypothetical protein